MDNVQVATNPVQVTIPDGTRVTSTHTCEARLPQVPKKGRFSHVLPGLARHSLISIVRLCNAGCEVKFTKIECIVTYRGCEVLRGKKCLRTGLWMVHLNPSVPENDTESVLPPAQDVIQPSLQANHMQEYAANVIPTSSKAELAMYYHQILCSPPASTMIKAIKNNQLRSFPGLTIELITKHLPPSTATEKGHMIRTRQGVRSTHSNRKEILDARLLVDDMNPPEQACTAVDNEMFCFAVLADEIEGTISSDQMGQFPTRSFSGKNTSSSPTFTRPTPSFFAQ